MKPFEGVETIAILVCKWLNSDLFKNEISYRLCKQITDVKLWHIAIFETI